MAEHPFKIGGFAGEPLPRQSERCSLWAKHVCFKSSSYDTVCQL
jgi:hypothetical protein